MEELKFERAEGTWAAAPGLDIRALTRDAELRVRRPPSRSTASHNGGCTVYSNGKPSCRRLGRQARHEWSAIEAVKASCWGERPAPAFFPWPELVSRRLDRTRAMLAHFGLELCGMPAPR